MFREFSTQWKNFFHSVEKSRAARKRARAGNVSAGGDD